MGVVNTMIPHNRRSPTTPNCPWSSVPRTDRSRSENRRESTLIVVAKTRSENATRRTDMKRTDTFFQRRSDRELAYPVPNPVRGHLECEGEIQEDSCVPPMIKTCISLLGKNKMNNSGCQWFNLSGRLFVSVCRHRGYFSYF